MKDCTVTVNSGGSMTTRHTPTPWETGPLDCRGVPIYSGPGNQDELVAYVENMQDADTETNAAFIVRAVNAHDDLVDVLRAIRRAVDAGRIQGVAGTPLDAEIDHALRLVEEASHA